MAYLTTILIALIAALHLYIMWFEMFAWVDKGPGVFEALPADVFPQTVELAANQGLYNLFLVIGLTWSLFIAEDLWRRRIAACFLLFVLAAGVFVVFSVPAVRPSLAQIVPASIALALLYLEARSDPSSA